MIRVLGGIAALWIISRRGFAALAAVSPSVLTSIYGYAFRI
jgi:hypothetical protein